MRIWAHDFDRGVRPETLSNAGTFVIGIRGGGVRCRVQEGFGVYCSIKVAIKTALREEAGNEYPHGLTAFSA